MVSYWIKLPELLWLHYYTSLFIGTKGILKARCYNLKKAWGCLFPAHKKSCRNWERLWGCWWNGPSLLFASSQSEKKLSSLAELWPVGIPLRLESLFGFSSSPKSCFCVVVHLQSFFSLDVGVLGNGHISLRTTFVKDEAHISPKLVHWNRNKSQKKYGSKFKRSRPLPWERWGGVRSEWIGASWN